MTRSCDGPGDWPISTRWAPSNLNYFLHIDAEHKFHDQAAPLVFLHYHSRCMKADGLIVPVTKLSDGLKRTVCDANGWITEDLDILRTRGFCR